MNNKIDYYCFCVDNLDSELWSEMDVNDNGSNFKKNLTLDVSMASEMGKCLFYLKNNDIFMSNGNIIDIKDKIIFPRCAIPDSDLLLSKIQQNGGKSIVTLKDKEKILSWPKYFQPVNHSVIETTKNEFVTNFEKYKNKFGRVFFKTKRKYYSCEVVDVKEVGNVSVIKSQDDFKKFKSDGDFNNPFSFFLGIKLISTKDRYGYLTGHDNTIGNLDDDERVFVENYIDIARNKENPDYPEEYRCFVIDGKLANISHYDLTGIEVEKEYIEFANKIIKNLPNNFPKYYVMDICKINSEKQPKFDVIEFNSIESSGYGEKNSIMPTEQQEHKFTDEYQNEDLFEK